MKREEEIKKYAEEKCILYDNIGFDGDIYSLITETINWADKHPKRYNQDELCDIQLEMMKQRDKRLIKKVCEWLKENIDIYTKVVINHKSSYPEIAMCDNFEENFIKAMTK